MNKWWVIGMIAMLILGAVCPAMAATPTKESGKELTEKMEEQMLEFVRNNYPNRMNIAVRSLQNQESKLHKNLAIAAQFLEGFSVGPVKLEGRWEGTGQGARYMLLSIVKGVQHYPNATVFFKTYPGLFRPFTVVQVDADSDGKVDEQSTALCKQETMLEWLSERFPQAVCLARKK